MMKYFVLCFLTYAWLLLTPLSVDAESKIEVIGSTQYQEQVHKALALLREKAPSTYQLVSDYVGIIQQSPKSGMFAYSDPPTYQMADRTAFYSVS